MAVAPVAWLNPAELSQLPAPGDTGTATVRVTVVDVAAFSPPNRPPAIATTAAAVAR